MPDLSLERPSRRPAIGRRHSALAASSSPQQALHPIAEPASPEVSGNGDVTADGPPANKRARMQRSRSARGSSSMLLRRNARIAAGDVEAAPKAEPTQYEEMMARFQVRQMQRSPSVLTDASVDSRRVSVDASSAVDQAALATDHSASSPPKTLYRRLLTSRHSTRSSVSEGPEARYRLNSDHHRGLAPSDRASSSSVGNGRPGDDGSIQPPPAGVMGRLVAFAINAVATPISPFSTLCQARYTLLLGVTVLYLLYFPLELAFSTNKTSKAVRVALSALFGVDALLELNTAVVSKSGTLVTSRLQIAAHYIKYRLLVDAISSLPVDLIMERYGASDDRESTMPSTSLGYVTYVFRMKRLVLVVRLVRLVWQLRVNESANTIWTWALYSRYSHLLRIGWIILLVLVIAHYIACIWAMLALSATPETNSWSESYAYSFYSALQLLQGQGIPTESLAQDVFASLSILLGSLVLATVFGHVAILVANFNATMTNYQRKMEGVFAVMAKMRLPPLLRERVHEYYEHLWAEYECLDGELAQFTKELSHSLELEVVLFKYMEVVMHIPFFQDCSPDFQKQLLLSLHARVYLPDDFILRQGEVGDELFIVNRGYCELVGTPDTFERVTGRALGAAGATGANQKRRFSHRRSSSSMSTGGHDRDLRSAFELDDQQRERVRLALSSQQQPLGPARQTTIVSRGQAVGDLALLVNYPCAANVRAITHVEMCVLGRKRFQAVLTRYPEDRKRVVLAMLSTYMAVCETSGLPCPLLDAVRSVFVPSVVDSLSAAEAAERVFRAIDADLRDSSIKFGIDDTTRAKLERLRDRRRQESEPKAEPKATEPTPSPARRPTEGEQVNQSGPQRPIRPDGSVTATEREMVAARLQQIEERERAIQAALRQLDASLTRQRAKHAAELLQARGMDCAACVERTKHQTATVGTQTPTSPQALKPRWSRVKSQPRLNNINELADDVQKERSQAEVAAEQQSRGPVWRLSRQRSHSVVVSARHDLNGGAIRSSSPLATVPLLQRMGTFVHRGSAAGTATDSPTRFADELFKPKRTVEAASEAGNALETPPQRADAQPTRPRKPSASESNAVEVADTVPNRRRQFHRKLSRSLGNLASADGTRAPQGLLGAVGSIVGLLDGVEAAQGPHESPTRFADELFQHMSTRRGDSLPTLDAPPGHGGGGG